MQNLLPKQKKGVKIENSTLLNVPIYRCENGCKWRALPEKFGHRRIIYMRLNRWAKSGVLERFFGRLKVFHCVCARYEKLDVLFIAFILAAIISISLHCVHTP
jgi:transposase